MNPDRRTKKQLIKDLEELRKKIDELRKDNHVLKESDARTQLLCRVFADSPDSIIIQDMEGRILSWNNGAERMYGYSADEALKMNISGIIPDDRKEEMLSAVQRIRKGGNHESLQTKRMTKDGRIIDVWLTLTKLVDENGNVAGIITNERDVTEHNRLLGEIETALALAEAYTHDIEPLVAERTASLIALNIADRVSNPAVVIGTISKRMIQREDLDEEVRKKFEIMFNESRKLQKIVREFSDFLEARHVIFSYDDLNTVVKEAVLLIKKEAEAKGVQLITELSDSPLKINMNRNVLRTAVYYILKNSLEAISADGRIKAVTSGDFDNVYLTISDTGHGIPEKDISRVFDHFFTTKGKGLGMGLTFVRHIVKEHLGDIKIESVEGKGTTCFLSFPVRWIKFSEGMIPWDTSLLPAPEEKHEYPLQVDSSRKSEGPE